MLDGADPHAVFGNNGGREAGVVNQIRGERNRFALFAGQIGAAERNAAVFRCRMQSQRYPFAGMQADAGNVDGLG